MLINICDCFLQSGSAPLQLQQHHSGGVFGILPSRCEVESARSRQRPNLEMSVFYFPVLAMPHGRKYKTVCLGVSSKTALHKPSLTAASVRLSCAWSLFAFVCCDAAGVRAGSTRAAPTSTPRATRDCAEFASKSYFSVLVTAPAPQIKIRAPRGCIVSDRHGQMSTDERTNMHISNAQCGSSLFANVEATVMTTS